MKIETPNTAYRIENDSYVTPFRTKAGDLFFVISPGERPGEAYMDVACFEEMTGLEELAQPRLYDDFSARVLEARLKDERRAGWLNDVLMMEPIPEYVLTAACLAAQIPAVYRQLVS